MATRLPSGKKNVNSLRRKVVAKILRLQERYEKLIFDGPYDRTGTNGERLFGHVKRMSKPGCFCEDPEFQAIADVLGTIVFIDVVVVEVPRPLIFAS